MLVVVMDVGVMVVIVFGQIGDGFKVLVGGVLVSVGKLVGSWVEQMDVFWVSLCDQVQDVLGMMDMLFINVFINMENVLFIFVIMGKLLFKDFVDLVIQDMVWIVVWQVMLQIIGGIVGVVSGFFGSGVMVGLWIFDYIGLDMVNWVSK